MGMLIVHDGRGKQMCCNATDGESYINSDGLPFFCVISAAGHIFSKICVFMNRKKQISNFIMLSFSQ